MPFYSKHDTVAVHTGTDNRLAPQGACNNERAEGRLKVSSGRALADRAIVEFFQNRYRPRTAVEQKVKL